MKIGNPFVRFACAGCGRWIERQIPARCTQEHLDALRDGPPLYCAVCEPNSPPADLGRKAATAQLKQ